MSLKSERRLAPQDAIATKAAENDLRAMGA